MSEIGIWLCPTCGHVASEQSEVSDRLKIKELENKVKDANETLTNYKTKLDLQKEMSRMYEKQQQEMMDILQIPKEDRSFAKVLNAVKAFQEAKAGIFNNTQEIFDDWARKVQQRNLGVSGRIFAIENTRSRTGRGNYLKLKVNFLPEIIQLSKEVRNLKNLGSVIKNLYS